MICDYCGEEIHPGLLAIVRHSKMCEHIIPSPQTKTEEHIIWVGPEAYKVLTEAMNNFIKR